MKNMEKKNSPVVRAGHIRFLGTQQGSYHFKTATSNAVKSCIHINNLKRRNVDNCF